jgi:hypothetical protein
MYVYEPEHNKRSLFYGLYQGTTVSNALTGTLSSFIINRFIYVLACILYGM